MILKAELHDEINFFSVKVNGFVSQGNTLFEKAIYALESFLANNWVSGHDCFQQFFKILHNYGIQIGIPLIWQKRFFPEVQLQYKEFKMCYLVSVGCQYL